MIDPGEQLEFPLFDDEDGLSGDSDEPSSAAREASKGSDEIQVLTASQMHDRQQALQALARQLANDIGMSRLAMVVRVEWNFRMRTAAGRAFFKKSLIELNPALVSKLPKAQSDDELDRTLKHELAHLVSFNRAGNSRIQPHGREWKQACRELGIAGEDRCHALPFAPRTIAKKYLYACPECQSEVPRVRPFKRPVACYACCRQHSRGRFDARFRLELVKKMAS